MLKHLGNVGLATLSLVFITSPVQASDVDKANTVLGTEGDKQALHEALKVAKSKPALSVAAAILCLACIPVAGAAASPRMVF